MKQVPSYGKIMTLGSYRTERALIGDVVVQEKVDGSFFGFGMTEDGELVIRSKNANIHPEAPAGMFGLGVQKVLEVADKIKHLRDVYFYGEYLNKPKHNVLKYERVPNGNIALFDILYHGAYQDEGTVSEWAEVLGMSVAPTLMYATNPNVPDIVQLLETDSFLGGEKIEGVVVKNYKETINLGGQIMPLITKYVRPDFQERNGVEWKEKRSASLQDYLAQFNAEPRWQKALQHLKECGIIEQIPKDIGALCKEVQRDLEEEEKENIKEELYQMIKKDLHRVAVRGVAEWYKRLLVQGASTETLPIS